jgi:hypothetical protein
MNFSGVTNLEFLRTRKKVHFKQKKSFPSPRLSVVHTHTHTHTHTLSLSPLFFPTSLDIIHRFSFHRGNLVSEYEFNYFEVFSILPRRDQVKHMITFFRVGFVFQADATYQLRTVSVEYVLARFWVLQLQHFVKETETVYRRRYSYHDGSFHFH